MLLEYVNKKSLPLRARGLQIAWIYSPATQQDREFRRRNMCVSLFPTRFIRIDECVKMSLDECQVDLVTADSEQYGVHNYLLWCSFSDWLIGCNDWVNVPPEASNQSALSVHDLFVAGSWVNNPGGTVQPDPI